MNAYVKFVSSFICLTLISYTLIAQNFKHMAGTGKSGLEKDSLPATGSPLFHPLSIAFDPDGNVFVADQSNHTIRKIDRNGTLSNFIGDGRLGIITYPQTQGVRLYSPAAIAFDADGNLIIADKGNHAIRKWNKESGEVTVIAGNGEKGYSGDGGPAEQAQLNNPSDVVIDPQGHIYIADRGNHRIRKIDAYSKVITTIAGSGDAGYNGDGLPVLQTKLNGPTSMDLDAAGNLYICDMNNCRIRKVSVGTSIVETIAGTGRPGFGGDKGPARMAHLRYPYRVRLDQAGNVYIADRNNHKVRIVTGGRIMTLVGETRKEDESIPLVAHKLASVAGLAIGPDQALWVADTDHHKLWKMTDYRQYLPEPLVKTEVPSAIYLGEQVELEELDGKWAARLIAEDKDQQKGHMFSLVEGSGGHDNQYFELVNDLLLLKEKANRSQYSIRLRVEDKDGLTLEQQLDLDLTLKSAMPSN